MSSDSTFFADTVVSARVSNGVVRVVMGTLTDPPAGSKIEPGKLAIRPAFELAMPISGIVDLTNAMQKLLQDMKQRMDEKAANANSQASPPPSAS